VAVIHIAHLGDAERMFVVALLLNQVVSWVRTLPGTTSLRALLYMDEIFGYFPPVANPPSKQPLLTLLKQARACGLGVVLATQNPVDLDYKGLANAGTWWIGRLQTERDKARVLEGLEGAAVGTGAAFDRGAMERTLAGLGKRTFLMNNVHENAPVVFQVRWTMSYLRGPLTRDQIKRLTADSTRAREPEAAAPPPAPSRALTPVADGDEVRPLLPPDVPQVFVPVRSAQPAGATLAYQPLLLGTATLHFVDAKLDVDASRTETRLCAFPEGVAALDWGEGELVELDVEGLENEPSAAARYTPPPAVASRAKRYDAWRKGLTDYLYRSGKLELAYCAALDQLAAPDEPERAFRVRLQQAAREQRDAQAAKLRAQYGPKQAALEERLRRAQQAVEREQAQSMQSTWGTVVSVGSTVLGAFLGRKTLSATNMGKAATAVRGVGRSWKEAGDVGRATENVQALQQQVAELETTFEAELAALDAKVDPAAITLDTKTIKPKKANIAVQALALAWVPSWQTSAGGARPAWREA
jgi:hypothetical protein